MYCDLNVVCGKSTTPADRKRNLSKLCDYGVDCVAFSTTVVGRLQDKHMCTIQPVAFDSTQTSSSIPSKRRNQSLFRKEKCPRQLTRITVVCDSAAEAQQLVLTSEVLQSYDIVAAQATSAPAFAHLCSKAAIDIITIDLSSRLSFHIGQKLADVALKRGVSFEVCYGPAIRSATCRRHLITNTQALVQFTGGKGLIMSSGTDSVDLLRSPLDAANLCQMIGLSQGSALASVSSNCTAAILRSEARKSQYKGITVSTLPADSIDALELTVPAEYYLPEAKEISGDKHTHAGLGHNMGKVLKKEDAVEGADAYLDLGSDSEGEQSTHSMETDEK